MTLMQHAKRELKIAGFDEKSAEVSGKIARGVLKLIRTLEKQNLDDFSLDWVLKTFNRLAMKTNLTPLTDNSDEWINVSDFMGAEFTVYQSVRNKRCYTTDFVNYFDTADQTNYKETVNGLLLKPLDELNMIPLKEVMNVSVKEEST